MRLSRVVLALTVLPLGLFTVACSGGGDEGQPDTTPPTVTATSPVDGATGVAKDAVVRATFSEPLDTASLSDAWLTVDGGAGPMDGAVSWDGTSRSLTLTPVTPLAAGTLWTATVQAGLADAAGNVMETAHVWTFETAPPTPGDLDATFGSLGITRTDIGASTFDAGNAIAIQGDDRIVVAGGSAGAFALVRYTADGVLDETFGVGGKVSTAVGAVGAQARAVAIQEDGKIVAAGTWGYDGAVVRYEADGTLDDTFGTGGIVTTTLGAFQAVAVDGSGRIVVAGESDTYSSSTNSLDFFVARYTAAGVPDTGFSTDGFAFVDFKPSSYTSGSALADHAYGVTIESGGRIVVVGRAENTAWLDDIGVAALNDDGTLNRKAALGIGKLCNNDARAVALQSGKLVAAGMVDYRNFGVMRFGSTLGFDATFDADGWVQTDLRSDGTASEDYAYALAVQDDGKLVVAGRVRTAGVSPYPMDFALARYLPDGQLDTTFGGGGKVITDAGSDGDVLSGVAFQSDGSIVVAGTVGDDFAVARYVP